MLNLFIAESLVCQLVSWPFTITACSWQQWLPALAGLFAALGLRVNGVARLATFVVGIVAFYLFAIAQVLTSSSTHDEQSGGFLLGCLLLFPIASIISLSGLLAGDLFRMFRKRVRENNAST